MTRDDAMELLKEYTKNPNLIKHALAVEAAMRAYARRFGGDEETWGMVGILHDFDYEKYPDLEDHPFKGVEILRERGWPEEIIEGVLAHAPHTGEPRDTDMKKAIFAVDELTGLIVATALVHPDGIADVEVESVVKKMKDSSFAASVSREDIRTGAEELGVDLQEHISVVLGAMQEISDDLGL
ncbi:MAG: HDIG domain-containing protein [Armatimonadota bacterium]